MNIFPTVLALVCTLSLSCFAADRDGDGCNCKGGTSKQQLLHKFDTNHDGKLDDGERAAMQEAFKERREENHEKMLAKYDTNHDGKLDDAEKAVAKADRERERDEREAKFKKEHPILFAKIDTNSDGRLDDGERKAWREAHCECHEDSQGAHNGPKHSGKGGL